MRIAITGSQKLSEYNLEKYISDEITEIISTGNNGFDKCVKEFALKNNIKYNEIIPQYNRYSDKALLIRNYLIAEYVDFAIVFWDGEDIETKLFINVFKERHKTIYIIRRKNRDSN
ncbi:MAG: hypothetical protein IJD93_04880 [Ruminococcus sp.]|nr:hypothetical protein [Ruminococcus sp.]